MRLFTGLSANRDTKRRVSKVAEGEEGEDSGFLHLYTCDNFYVNPPPVLFPISCARKGEWAVRAEGLVCVHLLGLSARRGQRLLLEV